MLITTAACSSAPKQPAAVYAVRNQAVTQLELANRAADRGDYAGAMELLETARRMAVSADDPELRIRTDLSRGNILSSQGRAAEVIPLWTAAAAEAEEAGTPELAALARIYISRGKLLENRGSESAAQEVLSEVSASMARIKNDALALALGWTVTGMAEKELRRWAAAEASLQKALDIHEKGLYLELAAYDWYLIASVRSVAGNYDAALEALSAAIETDRRTENTYGLGMDWLAMGDVYKKAGRPADAQAAWQRSAEIFRSGFFDAAAEEAQSRR